MQKHFIYIARCSDGTLYTGYTIDLKKREALHNKGAGARYTSGRRPVKIVYSEEVKTKSEALKRECQVKRLKRKDKENLTKSI